VIVQKEQGDRVAQASGFTRQQHGYGAEIHLLYLILQVLNSAGFNLATINLADDGHLYGDGTHMRYLRTPKKSVFAREVPHPYLYIVDGNYALRSSAEVYNEGKEVRFEVHGNVWRAGGEDTIHRPQANWFQKVKALCDQYNGDDTLECTLHGDAEQFEQADQRETADAV